MRLDFPGQKETEHVEIVIEKHWIVCVPIISKSLAMVTPALALFVATAVFDFFEFSEYLTGLIIIGCCMYILLVLLYISIMFLEEYLDAVVVTNERLVDIDQITLFQRSISETTLDKIEDVSNRVSGILGTALGFGNVHIQTAARDSIFEIKQVSRPDIATRRILDIKELAEAEESIANAVRADEEIAMLHSENEQANQTSSANSTPPQVIDISQINQPTSPPPPATDPPPAENTPEPSPPTTGPTIPPAA